MTRDPTVDAVRPAPDACYEAQAARPPLDAHDRAVASAMLGRPVRGQTAVAVRCAWGLPAVLRVGPRLDDGTPFPTTFWLSCPLASSAVGRLEARGVMRDLADRVHAEPPLAAAYTGAAQRYVAFRDALGGDERPASLRADARTGGRGQQGGDERPASLRADARTGGRGQQRLPVPRGDAAGGMPERVKCLHALYGHHLATGDNPIGAWVGQQVEPLPCPGPCV